MTGTKLTIPSFSKVAEALRDHEAFVKHAPNGRRLDLKLCDLEGYDFTGMNLSYARLAGSGLRFAVLSGVNLSEVDVFAANFDHADLVGANLSRAVMRGARLRGANLANATLERVDLRPGYLMTQFPIASAQTGNRGARTACLQTEYAHRGRTESDCTNANLTGVHAPKARMAKIILVGAAMKGANLVEADLQGADLSGADFSGADLSGANLTNATTAGTNFSQANLTRATVTGTLMPQTPIIRPDLAVRPGAEETDVATLIAAHIEWVRSGGSRGSRADLSGRDGSEQPTVPANFAGCNFRDADLTEADLRLANLMCADFSGAKLVGAKLKGARTRRAIFAGADLESASMDALEAA